MGYGDFDARDQDSAAPLSRHAARRGGREAAA
jgi:hypothetical protein